MYEGPLVNVIANNYSGLHKALLFLMRLAWKSRIRLPYLIMIGFMVLDIRMTLEVIIDVEVHQMPNDLPILEEVSDSDIDSETDSDDESLPPIQHNHQQS